MKLRLVIAYLAVWVFAVIVFWCFTCDQCGMEYSLVFLWIVIPLATFVISLLISKNNCWGGFKWLGSIGFGIMYMLAEYATFSMANNLAFDKINPPEYPMIAIGTAISLIGMAVGHLLYLKHSK